MADLNESKIDALLSAVRGGSDLDTACHFAGLSNASVYRWLERGKAEQMRIEAGMQPIDSETDFLELWEELKRARAAAIMRNLTHVQKAAAETWKAAAWWLERTVPEVYGSNKPAKTAPDVTSAPLSAPEPVNELTAQPAKPKAPTKRTAPEQPKE
jgi:hypothetical protein